MVSPIARMLHFTVIGAFGLPLAVSFWRGVPVWGTDPEFGAFVMLVGIILSIDGYMLRVKQSQLESELRGGESSDAEGDDKPEVVSAS